MNRNLPKLLCVLVVAGCTASAPQPPVSLAPTQGAGPPDTMPQAPNSLPPGAQVQAPFTASEGTVNNVQVGPGGGRPPVTSTTRPIAGTGTGTAPGRPNRLPNSY